MERGNPFFAQRKILSSNMVEMIGKALLFAFKFKMLDILWIEKKTRLPCKRIYWQFGTSFLPTSY